MTLRSLSKVLERRFSPPQLKLPFSEDGDLGISSLQSSCPVPMRLCCLSHDHLVSAIFG